MRPRTLVSICVLILVSGCALTRGELDVRVDDVPNPDTAQVVKITQVTDNRVFQVKPSDPSIPSLKEDEVNDRSIEKRAIARKRGTYGQAFGDILLPPGRTVEQLTRDALVKALRESGIGVVSEGEPGYETARPLQAEIRQFWAWFVPGFWEITLQYEAKVALQGDWPVAETDRVVEGKALLNKQIAATSQWQELFAVGIGDLIDNVKRAVRKHLDARNTMPAGTSRSLDGPRANGLTM